MAPVGSPPPDLSAVCWSLRTIGLNTPTCQFRDHLFLAVAITRSVVPSCHPIRLVTARYGSLIKKPRTPWTLRTLLVGIGSV